jgi:hypothetical protein
VLGAILSNLQISARRRAILLTNKPCNSMPEGAIEH